MTKRGKKTTSRKRKAPKRPRRKRTARKRPTLSGKIAGALAGVVGTITDSGRMRDKLSRPGDSETE